MKKIVLTIASIIVITGISFAATSTSGSSTLKTCTGTSGCAVISGASSVSGSALVDNKNNTVKFTTQKWYITAKAYNSTMTYYEMHLKLAGTTTASSVVVQTFGGGLIGSQALTLQNGKFNQDVVIAFRMLQNSSVWKKFQTTVNVTLTYPNGQVVVMPLTSPDMRYGQTLNSTPAGNSIGAPHGINSLPGSQGN